MAVRHNEGYERKSLEEYFALLESDSEHRYEYLDGYIYMMTGQTPDHAIIGNNVGRILGNLLQNRRCIVYNSDLYVELSDNYRVCPDVTVSCDPRDRGAKGAIRFPCLVVEVISPTTEARDRGKKSLQYRSCPTIQEYLLARTVDPETGRSVLYGRKLTGLTKRLERAGYYLTSWRLGDYYRTYPEYVEDETVKALEQRSDFVHGGSIWKPFVVEDGNLITARYPEDAHLFAEKLVERLK